MPETRINPSTGRPFNEIKAVATYRGFTFTTRISQDGYRVMMPDGCGILDFAEDVEEGKRIVDEYVDKVGY